MKFVYLIQSERYSTKYYTGITDDIKKRMADHNTGKSSHTSKYKPWKLITYTAFTDEHKAFEFEKYLKSGSGKTFPIITTLISTYLSRYPKNTVNKP